MEIHVMREVPEPQPLPAVQSVTLVLTKQEFEDLQVAASENLRQMGRRNFAYTGRSVSFDRIPVLEQICAAILHEDKGMV